mgnify:CR=1 FL=1
MDKNTVKVNIYGSEYVIKGDADTGHIEEISQFVDQKMKEINKSGAIKSPLKVAILAALNIADEYFKTRNEQKKQIASYEARTQKLLRSLSANLKEKEVPVPAEDKEEEEISLFSQK